MTWEQTIPFKMRQYGTVWHGVAQLPKDHHSWLVNCDVDVPRGATLHDCRVCIGPYVIDKGAHLPLPLCELHDDEVQIMVTLMKTWWRAWWDKLWGPCRSCVVLEHVDVRNTFRCSGWSPAGKFNTGMCIKDGRLCPRDVG